MITKHNNALLIIYTFSFLLSVSGCSLFDSAWSYSDSNIRKTYEDELNISYYFNNEIHILNSESGNEKIDSSNQLELFFKEATLNEVKFDYDEKKTLHNGKTLYSFIIENSLDNFELLEDNNYISLYRFVDREVETFDIYKIYELNDKDYKSLIELIESI